jgi:UDP-glucose 4-epimerase
VCDLAHAHVLALNLLLNGGDAIAVNLGTGQGISIQQVIDMPRPGIGHGCAGARRAAPGK